MFVSGLEKTEKIFFSNFCFFDFLIFYVFIYLFYFFLLTYISFESKYIIFGDVVQDRITFREFVEFITVLLEKEISSRFSIEGSIFINRNYDKIKNIFF